MKTVRRLRTIGRRCRGAEETARSAKFDADIALLNLGAKIDEMRIELLARPLPLRGFWARVRWLLLGR
jgi:hypothetical protein